MLRRRTSITTGTVAEHCEVTYETVKNWIRQGKLPAYETPGGHHRILIEEFGEFLARYGMPPYDDLYSRKPKVLIVDDDTTLVATIADYLTKVTGYDCASASDGYEAGVQVMGFDPDVVILDLIMPMMNGFEVCQKIKASKDTDHILILAITGHPEDGNADKILAAGADDVLPKPFKLEELKEHVDKLFEKRKARRRTVRSSS
jgi:excisionase family DNA binding protein